MARKKKVSKVPTSGGRGHPGPPKQYKSASLRPDPGKGKRGPKLHPVDWDYVKRLAEDHCTVAEIAAAVGMTKQGLAMRKEFYSIYHAAYLKGNISLRRLQFAAAEAGEKTILIWLGKNYLGQTDNWHINNTIQGPNGGPVQVQSHDWTKLTDDELRQVRALYEKAKAVGVIGPSSGQTIDVTTAPTLPPSKIVKRGNGRHNGKSNGKGK